MTRVRTARPAGPGLVVRVGVAPALVLALLAACGDDGGGDGSGGGDGVLGTDGPDEVADAPAIGGPGAGFDPCGLLEVAEIEAQWPDLGPVGAGNPVGSFCTWPLDEVTAGPAVTVGVLGHQLDHDAAGSLAVLRETMSEPVAVEAGDEAYASGDWLYVRAGENLLNVTAVGFAPDAGSQVTPLTALADAAADRLPDDYLGP